MITHPPTKTQGEDASHQSILEFDSRIAATLKMLRAELQKLEQSIQVLENCRAADSLTLQSFQKRNVQLMRAIATRDARIIELQREVELLLQHLNPLEIECQGAECCGGKFPPANLLGKDSSQAVLLGEASPSKLAPELSEAA